MRATAIISARLPQFDAAYAIDYARQSLRMNRHALLVLAVAFLVDLAFVGLHVFQSATGELSENAYVYEDGGYAEWFQYLKYALILGMTLVLLRRTGNVAYLTLATMAAFLLVDDSLRLHERAGDWLAPSLAFDTLGGLRAEDFGELAVYALAGGVFLLAAIAGHLRQDPEGRRFLMGFYVIVAALGGFAVGMDMVRIIGEDVLPGLGLIEDSGEMFVTSVLLAFVLERLLASRSRSAETPARP